MNKNRYRIVFNRARGMLMVVADIAASGLSTSSPTSGVGHTRRHCISPLGRISFSLLLALGCISTPGWARIVADGSAPGQQQPTITHSASGTPQINIQAPSAAGVSHNKYTHFDVDQKGAILNNANKMTQTQLGGMVVANPWLAKGTAKVILNEVNSRNPSQLNGMIEVAGRKAQIVIANPAGITCDGCGFINANRATLTTGQVQMANGYITGYDVNRGTITVQGRGMDSTRQDSTELIARAIKVNATIQAGELDITAGRNTVNATDRSIVVKADDGSQRPQFAVDVAQLGGMYANKIQLRGTERGVGVHNAGTLGASAGDVVVNADGSITSSGHIQASNNLRLASRHDINSSGVLAAGIKTNGIASAAGDLVMDSDGRLTVSGQNSAANTLTAKGVSADFSGSQSRAAKIELAARQGDVATRHASMAAQKITVSTGGMLNNDGGNLSAETLELTARQLSNRRGVLLHSGETDLTLAHAGGIDNRDGKIVTNSRKLRLSAAQINNQQGRIQAAGNLHATAEQALENSEGLIHSGKTATLSASRISNQGTGSAQQGIEGQSIILETAALDNTEGAVRGGDELVLNSAGAVDNARGLLSSFGLLSVNGGQSLALNNSAGTLIAGKMLRLEGGSATGDGRLLSQDAMTLTLQKALLNAGQIIANGNASFIFAGGLSNEGLIKAGGVMTTRVPTLLNRVNGEINAAENHLLVSDALTNQGLLDGGLTHISATTLDNNSSGRIYGDHVALQAETLNNLAQAEIAPVIAARTRMDIGVGTLNNLMHAMIYSAGEMAIGRRLNDTWQAEGQAQALNNHSATLEATGNMTLNVDEINNRNDTLKTHIVETENTAHHEAVLNGTFTRYNWDVVDISSKNKYGVHMAKMPDGLQSENFYEYIYLRRTTEVQVVETDPGRIMAGGNLSITSDRLNNEDSMVVAGGLLGVTAGELNNLATPGERAIVDRGSLTHWYAKKKKRKPFGTVTSQGIPTIVYKPDPVIQTIDLKQTVWQSRAQVNGSGTAMTDRNSSGMTASITGPDSMIRITPPDIRLPDSSRYQLHPANNVPFLIETDPRFTNRRQWLSSDYMQQQFSLDSGNILKRLGDGFYEQSLIRQQLTQLTGNRFLKGFDNDENQYLALMNAGVAFGKQHSLVPGVALTPLQMALLTSDMVWLIKQDVTLPDGRIQSVLVPQVYARVRQGDLDGSGALMSGNNVLLKVKNDLTNSGQISGLDMTQIAAESITNGGYLDGNRVSLQATGDINNTGGTLRGGDSLMALAGRDFNSISRIRGEGSNSWVDRPAGVFVQHQAGELTLHALNNVNLTGSLVSNRGENSTTQLTADNDLNLNTITTTESESADWGGGNYRYLSRQTDSGASIVAGGDLLLKAGRDVTTKAASVSADAALKVQAGRDINIATGATTGTLVEHSKQSGRGLLSGFSLETHDELHEQLATGSTLSAGSVDMLAGRDALMQGGNIVGTESVSIAAKRDISITEAQQSRQEVHSREDRKSGLMSSGGIGFTIGSQKETTENARQDRYGQASMMGSLKGDTVLLAGDRYQQTGSRVSGPEGNVLILGKNVTIAAGENTASRQHTQMLKQKGLTVALNVPVVVQVVQSLASSIKSVGKSSDDRVNMLAAANAVWDSKRAADILKNSAPKIMENGVQEVAQNISVSLTYGQKQQKDTSTTTETTANASQLTAGKNARIIATGGDRSDINIMGSDISGSQSTLLQADNNVNIAAARQQQHQREDNQSTGWNAGIAVSYGSGGAAFGITAGGSVRKGHGNTDSLSWRNSYVGGRDSLTRIASGENTTLKGAQVQGNRVEIDAANLAIESLQDTMKYAGKQTDISGQVTVGYGFSGSASFQNSRVKADYASVQEQSGIFAGQEGYRISVNDRTDLKGGLITSSAHAERADNNHFSTGTLTAAGIRNHADYKGKGSGLGLSVKTSEPGSDAPMEKTPSSGTGHDSGSEGSITHSGINTASITITRPGEQYALSGKTAAQMMAEIKNNITTETAAQHSGKLTRQFDKDKVFNELNLQVKVTQAFSLNAAQKIATLLDAPQAEAREKLQQALKENDPVTRDQALDEINRLQYQRRFLQTLVGVIAGSPEVAITHGTLAAAATAMRHETLRNSLRSPSIVDRNEWEVSNTSQTSGAYDGIKLGGVRMSLDILCGADNKLCKTQEGDSTNLLVDNKGRYRYKGDEKYPTLNELLEDKKVSGGLYGSTGGFQGSGGLMFGIPYKPGNIMGDVFDTVVESFAGTHDFIGGQLPGFYDKLGNTSRGREPWVNILAESWTVAAIPVAAPFALSELVSPELLSFIFSASK